MDNFYFLIAIGVLAFVLVSWLVNRERRHLRKDKKHKSRVQNMAQLHHRHLPTVHHGLPGRTTSFPPLHTGAWELRHQRAGEERRDGSAIIAEKISSDEESPEVEQGHGLAMSTITYVPEAATKASQPRR